MAGHARCTREVVTTVLGVVTVGALARGHRVQSCQWEIHHGVIERRRGPGSGRMTLAAVCGEISRYVIRVCRALKIFEVATDAGRRSQVVIVVGVTVGAKARRNRMSAGQRKSD